MIMVELLVDFGFDLLYGWFGSVFISRDNGFEVCWFVVAFGWGLDVIIVVVIFFEGWLF